jgi:tRNA threonylcarbamoyladenosine biosynthesis protein TsaB
MLLAALDSATLTLSCALLEVDEAGATLLAERTEPAPRAVPGGAPAGHGSRLPGALSDLLVACDRRLPEVEAYAVGLGPGSFTGLRIGLATFKGLAYANRRPIGGASSLAAMALAAAPAAGPGTVLLPLLDAKKGEVYAGFYRAGAGGVEAVRPDAALAPEALLEALAELPRGLEPLGFGEGYEAHAARLQPRLTHLRVEVRTPSAAAVGRAARGPLRPAAALRARAPLRARQRGRGEVPARPAAGAALRPAALL